MGNPFNVLISCAGRRVALLDTFRHALAELALEGQVMATDRSRLSAAYHLADHSFLVPDCTSPEFIPAMLELCRSHEIRLLIPTIDTELPVYAAHRRDFDAIGTTVAVSSPEVVATAGDKGRTHAWLGEAGLPTVRQTTIAEVLASPEVWPFPLLAKPIAGSSSTGVFIAEDAAELQAVAKGGDYIVQTIASGWEYTIDVLVDRSGKCVCAIPRRRLEVRGGEISKGFTLRSELLENLAMRVVAALPGAYGVLNVQAFHDDRTQELNVIEVNARFGGGFPLSWEAGGKYPRWMIEEILGLPSTASQSSWRSGVVMLRYECAVFVDAEPEAPR